MPGYFDIDDILMEDEPISVVFHVTANGVGLLDPGAESNCVEKGAKVELPFWLAHGLLSLEQAVSINPPACFTQKTRKEIQANAACVDLRVRCPYFYELGCKIVPLVSDEHWPVLALCIHQSVQRGSKQVSQFFHDDSAQVCPTPYQRRNSCF
ncbi:hypothetical protein PVAP13_6NG167900 [Panicum virgatum]|uniref:DNA replication complex GINS protein PSF3 N-terminal domain-containing protein n=1 Tax=Panicum virgatum TaxID=38727 RepID=A0A8T0QVY6_PANVG|nr:hypothetical protein PVAP13_6NG167900 [Panicum virgatum]